MAGDAKRFRVNDLIESGDLLINDGYRAKNSELSQYGIPFARAGNISNGFHFEDADRFPTEDLHKAGIKVSLPGDVVFTSKGTVGRFAFVCEDTPRFVYSPQLCFWRSLNPQRINGRWLYYWMHSREFYAQYSGVAGQTDMAEYVNLRDQRRMHITLPLIDEQRAIAHILGALDDKIELNRRMNDTLEAMARALFKSWFVDFDPVRARVEGRDPGLPPHLAALFPNAFQDSEMGEIPEGWSQQSLGTLFPQDPECVITGPFGSNLHASDYRDDGIPLLLVKHVNDGKIFENDIPRVGFHKVPELERYRLRVGDIIFTRVGAVGRSAYIFPRYEGWMISGQTLRVRVSDTNALNPRFLAATFVQPSFVNMVESLALGSTRPSLNTKLLADFRFVYPTPELQSTFARVIEPLDMRQLANAEQSNTLTAIRDTLLPKLMSGGIRVKNAENFVEE